MEDTTDTVNGTAHGNTTVDESCELFLVIWRVGITGLICTVGIIGNILCLVMFHRLVGSLSASMMILLKALAWADLLYVSLFSLIIVWPYLLLYLQKEHIIQPALMYCYAYVWPVVSITISLSTWYTVLISVHRYIAVIHPLLVVVHSSVTKIRRHLVITSLVAVIIDIPRFFEITIFEYTENNVTYKYHDYSDMYKHSLYQLIYKNIIMCLYRKIIPLVIITVLGIRLILAIHRAKKARQNMQNAETSSGRSGEMKVTITMLAIMVTFVLCQLPSAIYPIVRLLNNSVDGADICDKFDIFVRVADTLGVLNSSVNFIIYIASSQKFLQEAQSICCSCVHPKKGWKEEKTEKMSQQGSKICSPFTITKKEKKGLKKDDSGGLDNIAFECNEPDVWNTRL